MVVLWLCQIVGLIDGYVKFPSLRIITPQVVQGISNQRERGTSGLEFDHIGEGKLEGKRGKLKTLTFLVQRGNGTNINKGE